jgi:hypothetical protein
MVLLIYIKVKDPPVVLEVVEKNAELMGLIDAGI